MEKISSTKLLETYKLESNNKLKNNIKLTEEKVEKTTENQDKIKKNSNLPALKPQLPKKLKPLNNNKLDKKEENQEEEDQDKVNND